MSHSFRADLHCHSTCSDGTVSPVELVKLASEIGLNGLSITDHDSIEAYKTAIPLANELNLPLLTGVEFSAVHKGASVHILCYGFAADHPEIISFCTEHSVRRTVRNQAILEKLNAMGMPLSEEDIFAFGALTIGRPHIALAMISKGYVSTVQEAFKLYLAEDKPAYAPGPSFSVEETLERIHKAKGLAVIAHPHLIETSQTFLELLSMPFDGMECFYGKFAPEQNQRYLKIATRRNWLITGGSDFHGTIKPNLPLGSSWVDEERFNTLYKHYKNEVL